MTSNVGLCESGSFANARSAVAPRTRHKYSTLRLLRHRLRLLNRIRLLRRVSVMCGHNILLNLRKLTKESILPLFFCLKTTWLKCRRRNYGSELRSRDCLHAGIAPSSDSKFRAKRWRLVDLKAPLKVRSKMLKTSEITLRGVK